MSEFNFDDLASIGTPVESPASPIEQKREVVELSSEAKAALFGSPEEQLRIAANILEETALAEQEQIRDLENLDLLAYAAKYGVQAARSRPDFFETEAEFVARQEDTRSSAEVIGDFGVNLAQSLNNLTGGAATIGAASLDGYRQGIYALTGNLDEFRPMSPAVAGFFDKSNQGFESLRSEEGQADMADLGLRGQVATEDNALLNDGTVSGWFAEQGANVADTARRTWNSPVAMGQLATQGVASLMPVGAAGQALGRTQAIRTLMAPASRGGRGMTREAAEQFILTDAGQEFVSDQVIRATTALIGATEGGAGTMQAAQGVLNLPEKELLLSPDYRALLADGVDPDAARSILAYEAGATAGMNSIPGSLLAGRVAAPFAANPTQAGSLIGAGRNVASETVEEAIQEANTTLASNYGQKRVGVDIALDEGVAEAATLGAMGGAMTAGGMQTPTALASVASGAGQLATGAIQARTDQLNRREDEASPVGSRAQGEAVARLRDSANALAASLTTPDQTIPNAEELGQSVLNAAYLTPDEELTFIESFPDLAEVKAQNGGAPLTRGEVINRFAAMVRSSDGQVTDTSKDGAALYMFMMLDRMRAVDSDTTVETLNNEGTDASRGALQSIQQELQTIESNPALVQAQERLEKLTPEQVEDLIDMDAIRDPDADPATKQEELEALETLARVNPNAVTSDMLNLALNQAVGGGRGGEMLRKRLELAKKLADEFKAVDEAKAQIEAEQDLAVAALTPEQKRTARARKHGTLDIVRQEIQIGGNSSNGLPSLQQHRRLVSDAATSGHMSLAQERLKELHAFAESQVNKVRALAESAANGRGSAAKVGFRAYNGQGFFDQKPVWVDRTNPASVAQAKEAEVDARTALALVQALVDTYGLQMPSNLELTPIDLTSTPTTPTQTAPQNTATEEEGDVIETETAPERTADLVESETEERRTADLVQTEDPVVQQVTPDLVDTSDEAPAPRKAAKGKTAAETRAQYIQDFDLERRAEILRDMVEYAMGLSNREVTIKEDAFFLQGVLDATREELIALVRRANLTNEMLVAANDVLVEAYEDSVGTWPFESSADFIASVKAADPQQDLFGEQQSQEEPSVEPEVEVVEPVSESADTVSEPVEASQAEPEQVTPQQSEPEQIAEAAPEAEAAQAPVGSWFLSFKERVLAVWDKGGNVLTNAFKPRESGSLLTKFNGSTDAIVAALRAGELRSQSNDRDLTEQEMGALVEMLSVKMPAMGRALNKRMNALIKQYGWDKDLKAGKGVKFLRFPKAFPLNAITNETDGNYEMDPAVVQAVYMATLDWIVSQGLRGAPRVDNEYVSKMFGLGRTGFVTDEMRQFARETLPMQSAIEHIARGIEELLGLEADPDAPLNETQGMFRSLAANAIELLADSDILDIDKRNFPAYDKDTGKTEPRTMYGVIVPQATRERADIQAVKGLTKPFAALFLPQQDDVMFVGSAPKRVHPNQIRNKLGPISQKARKVIERLQNSPAYINEGLLDLIDMIGEQNYLEMLGYVEVTEGVVKTTNVNKLESIKGKNQSLKRGIEGVRQYVDEADRFGEANGMGRRDVPIFFGWRLSSVNRLQQQGPVTPQGDKIARELISHTRDTVDLNDPIQYKFLWLAIAQSLDISIEKDAHENTVAQVIGLVSEGGALAPAVAIIQDMLQGRGQDAKALMEALAEAKAEPTPKLIHALMTVAQLNTHEGGSFVTHLALEADGKTDGPINAMVNMATGAFKPKDIERLAKGGYFFTDQPMSLSEFIRLENEQSKGTKKFGEDLYHMAASIFEDMISADAFEFKRLLPLYTLFDALLPDFELVEEKGNLRAKIERGLVKNPLTVFLYGSGEEGIANKLTNAMLDTLYDELTAAAQGKANGVIRDDIVATLSEMIGISEEAMRNRLKNPQAFKLTPQEFENMSKRVQETFAEPMLMAVNEATGGLVDNMRTMQAAASIQAAIFQDAYEKNQQALTGANGTMPSANDLEDTFIDQMGLAPIYETDDASYMISKPEKEQTKRTVSTSFSGQLSARLTGLRPADASVKVSPYMTIGMGDGQMMLNIYSRDGNISFTMTLPVFDGVEMPISQADGQSFAINQSVWEGWMQANVFKAVGDGFTQMLDRLTPEMWRNISLETEKKIRRALNLEKDVPLTYDHVVDLRNTLRKLEREHAARKAALKAVASSVDHMAGAESPFTSQGEAIGDGSPLDYDAIAKRLNELARAHMEAARLARDDEAVIDDGDVGDVAEADYVDPSEAAFDTALAEAGWATKYPGVRALKGKHIVAMLKGKEGGLSGLKHRILTQVLAANPEIAETTYYFGTDEALAAARDEIVTDENNTPIGLGLSYPGQGVAFIANRTAETVMHEMLHAATFKGVMSYFANPSAAAANVRFGVEQLMKLMAEVRGMSQDTKGLIHLKNILDEKEGRPAEQVLEFIAYMLSNQDLAEFGSKTSSYGIMKNAVRKALSALKKLLGLRESDMPTKDIFDQVRFNTQIISMTPVVGQGDIALNQLSGRDTRTNDINRRYQRRLVQFMKVREKAMNGEKFSNRSTNNDRVQAEFTKLNLKAKTAMERATAAGFRLNKQQQRAFRSVYAAMSSGASLSPAILRQMHTIHDQVLEQITAEALLDAGAFDQQTAEAMLSFIENGTTNEILPAFIALSESSPLFRKVLDKMKMRPAAKLQTESFDQAIESVGSAAMSALARMSVSELGREGSAGRQLDALSWAVSALETENRLDATMNSVSDRIDQANDYAASFVHKLGEKVDDFARQGAQRAPIKAVKLGFDALGFIGSMASPERSERRGEGMTMFFNRIEGWNSVRSALNDIRGATSTNIDVMRLINRVKAKIDAIRQDFREGVPRVLGAKFKKRLDSKEWSQMHKGLGVTDLAALGLSGMRSLVANPMTLSQRIATAEEALMAVDRNLAPRWQVKAEALAVYMVDGKLTTKHLLRNAEAIANLFGERNRPPAEMITADVIKQVEELVALYAYRQLDPAIRNKMASLYARDKEGMDTTMGFLASVRELERSKKAAEGDEGRIARYNGLQGYIPATGLPNHKIEVFEDKKHHEKTMQGWVRIGDYKGQPGDTVTGRRGYYQSSTAGKAAFRQGIAQTVHTTYNGVNVLTGQLMTDNVAGTLRGFAAKRLGENQLKAQPGNADNLPAGEYLIPIFNEKGEVVAYDRHMAPEKLAGLQKDTHLGRMLGVWAGRHFEEEAAHEFNRTLVDTLEKQYRDGLRDGRGEEFVNIADHRLKDPIYRDVWDTLGVGIKEYATGIFGSPNFFPVRRDQIEDAMGYRAASVTDIWTGQSRLPEPAQKAVKEWATMIAGPYAYPLLKKGESFVQDAVGVAKTTIIVRSAVVGVGNIISNVMHLSLRGVPMTVVAKSGREKILEIQEYVRNMEKIQELKIDFAAKIEDPVATQKIEARITALENANARMSIAPLIEAGEFSTISEDLTEADVAIREGKIMDYIERGIDQLPQTAGTIARNVLITKDTALYKGLNRMVQYGDFVAKAVLYDHLKAKGMSEQEVLDIIMEEFVQYNRLPGRGRDYLESMGMLWFMNYALRITKVMGKMARDRPLSSLVLMGQVGPMANIDSVFSGSLAGNIYDGSVDFKVGPEMGLNSPSLNPWYNLMR